METKLHLSQSSHAREDLPGSGRDFRQAKRQKVKLACQECRDRKVRCDGAKPICNSCSRKKRSPNQCIYSVAELEPTETYVRSLEKRVKELEANQESLSERDGGFEDSPRTVRTEELPAHEHSREYANPGNFNNHPPNRNGAVNSSDHGPSSTLPTLRDLVSPSRASSSRSAPAWSTEYVSPRTSTLQGHTSRRRRLVDSNALGETTSASPAHESTPGKTPGSASEHSPAFLGSSSAVGFMSEAYQTLKQATESTNRSPTQLTVQPEDFGRAPWFGHIQDEDKGQDVEFPDYSVPPRRIADQYLQAYWELAHPLQPFIFKQTFLKRYMSLWSSNQDSNFHTSNEIFSSPGSEHIFHCMFNLILALGCKFSTRATRPLTTALDKSERTFFDRATKLLTIDLLDSCSLQLVQTLLLMAQYLQNINLSNRCWVVVGMAIRVAQSLALHLDIAGETQAQREERRRAWYLCILMDRVHGMTFGRPLMVPYPAASTLPEPIDEEYLAVDALARDGHQPPDVPSKSAYFICVFRLSNATADILRLFYAQGSGPPSENNSMTNYNSYLRIDAELEEWKDSLPPFLRYDRSIHRTKEDSVNDLLYRQANLLHHRYLHSRILLFRRLVVQLAAKTFVDNEQSSASTLRQRYDLSFVERCTSAAQELLEVLQPHIGSLVVPPAWFTVFLIYSAGTALALVFLTPSFQSSLTADEMDGLRSSWSLCIDCLKQYELLGVHFASRCLLNLQKVYKGETDVLSENQDGTQDTENPNPNSTRPYDQPLQTAEVAGVHDAPWTTEEHVPNWSAEAGYYDSLMSTTWWPDESMDWFIDLANSNQR